MTADRSQRNGRLLAGAAAVLVQGLLLYALLFGLTVRLPTVVDDGLKVFGVALPPPPPPIEKPRVQPQKSHKKEGAASPANLRSKATEVVAPKPPVPVQPPPIPTAPVANVGLQATTGAAPVPGPGTGAGGIGNGTGSGRGGNGEGDGDYTEPRQIKGRLGFSDVRQDPGGPETLSVGVRFAVEVDGHVDGCVVTNSSGDRMVDIRTCQLIEQRFRFKPSRAPDGHPVRSYIEDTESFIRRVAPNGRDEE